MSDDLLVIGLRLSDLGFRLWYVSYCNPYPFAHLQSIISWIGAVTNATLIYLFRPSTTLRNQTPNPDIPTTGSIYLHNIVSTYDVSPTLRAVLPTLIPLVPIALAASHGFIVVRWTIENVAERLLWRGSEEETEVQRLTERGSQGVKQKIRELSEAGTRKRYESDEKGVWGSFWNGGEEGARAIGSVGKAE